MKILGLLTRATFRSVGRLGWSLFIAAPAFFGWYTFWEKHLPPLPAEPLVIPSSTWYPARPSAENQLWLTTEMSSGTLFRLRPGYSWKKNSAEIVDRYRLSGSPREQRYPEKRWSELKEELRGRLDGGKIISLGFASCFNRESRGGCWSRDHGWCDQEDLALQRARTLNDHLSASEEDLINFGVLLDACNEFTGGETIFRNQRPVAFVVVPARQRPDRCAIQEDIRHALSREAGIRLDRYSGYDRRC